MRAFNWEDPFGEEAAKVTRPALWMPGQRVEPANIKAIRLRQKELLPYINELRKAAIEIVRRVKGDASRGGEPLIKQTEHQLAVRVFFRMPDYPEILGFVGPFPMTDNAVVLPAISKPDSSVLDRLFPAQYVGEVSGDELRKKMLIDGRKEVGLIEHMGLSIGSMTPERVVVYPKLLHFTAHWIRRLKSPIFDLQYSEVPKEPGIRSGTAHLSPDTPTSPAIN